MLDAEVIMRERINRGEDCAFVAGDIMKMRAVMAGLARERLVLGDNDPIIVSSTSPRRVPAGVPVVTWSAKRHLVPKATNAACGLAR
jgi:hypothetical protein